MKHRQHFLLFVLLLVALVVSACGEKATPDPTATPTTIPPTATSVPPTATEVPPTATEIPPTPTEVPPTAVPPTATSVPAVVTEVPTKDVVVEEESEPFYTEEFDNIPQNWSYFLTSGDDNFLDVYADGGQLVFDLQGENQYVYYLYEDYYYEDVYVEIEVDNRGKSDNNVSMICRYSEEEGWYEANVTSNGLYNMLVYSAVDNIYKQLYNGGSQKINTGRDTNTYGFSCYDKKLTLYINGEKIREVTDNTYKLTEGLIGVGASSFKDLPVLLKLEYVYIGQPY